MNRIDKICVSGFKSIAELQLDIKDINVLIGGNGSGKSNFIGVFKFLREITEGRLGIYVKTSGGADSILHFGSKRTSEVTFHVYLNEKVDQYKISLSATVEDGLVPISETAYYWNKSYPQPYSESLTRAGTEAAISSEDTASVKAHVREALQSWRVYHFHDTSDTSPLKKTAKVDDNRFLRADGANLAGFLYLLKTKHEEEYRLIRNTVRRIAPFFKDFVLEPRSLNEESIRLEWRHIGTEDYFDVSSFSDGTLRFIALTVLLLQPYKYKPSVILLDEPELGLHPSAITVLGAMVRQASADAQVIISTQSPMLLDMFEPEEVVVVHNADGASTFKRLENSALENWLKEFSLGELWEKNEIGGKPGV
ncbi:putative ATPase [Maritalea mobilis]|uniref:Putative ATPase n=1 Tax=Maritalea mobilis TaxID=483324 RepID=A0A4R6VNV5_9HYPH|nr:AAA family ATPase [Maritalea mobilis]TDQ63890.1 putative ATPase [Maritalea mobilis]